MPVESRPDELPFPALLRREVFGPTGAPDWFVPRRQGRPLPLTALLGINVFAVAALMALLSQLTHTRTLQGDAQFDASSLQCAARSADSAGTADCAATLRLATRTVTPAPLPRAGEHIEVDAGGAAQRVRVRASAAAVSGRDATIQVDWAGAPPVPAAPLRLRWTQTHSLLRWLLPAGSAGDTPP